MRAKRWKPLAPRPIDWRMKPLESAETNFRRLADGRLELTIRHELVHGVTPGMLAWWFRNIEGTMVYEGRAYSRYHVWHPIDHIHYDLARPAADGTGAPGSQFHIVEAFGANPDFLVNSIADVPQNDERGISLSVRKFGLEVMRLEHTFAPTAAGTVYRSTMHVGAHEWPARWLVNHGVVPHLFSEAKGHAWLKHNVEEVGNFEFFLPELYATVGSLGAAA
jgi:hypothetical protein